MRVDRDAGAPRPLLADLVRSHLSACSNPAVRTDPGSRELYHRVLQPLRRYLPAGRTLVAIPDGPLHRVAFPALVSGEGRYLADEQPTAVAPSIDVLFEAASRAPVSGDRLVLARAYGVGKRSLRLSPVTRAVFGPLPEALPEARQAAASLGATLWTDAQATRARFFEALRGSVVWFSGHVHYDREDPGASALILAGPNGRDDPLTVRDLANVTPDAKAGPDLVVLSGCDSAEGQLVGSEGLVGLSWALLRAGARSVVGCRWKVDDRATRELMTRFAANLATVDRGEALRQAQLSMLRDRRWSHPYYWAAPTLIGRTDRLSGG